ncbi:hypothetical protein BJ742DRAFT_735053 [Cladochytrium replicatum]|nr:hypothetical protein BJ742DRAFT_735053 [Cladochytrium replicatum]
MTFPILGSIVLAPPYSALSCPFGYWIRDPTTRHRAESCFRLEPTGKAVIVQMTAGCVLKKKATQLKKITFKKSLSSNNSFATFGEEFAEVQLTSQDMGPPWRCNAADPQQFQLPLPAATVLF